MPMTHSCSMDFWEGYLPVNTLLDGVLLTYYYLSNTIVILLFVI